MHSRSVEITNPCHESWDAMRGDDARRFCDVCAKHVHNLSAMTRQDAVDLLKAHKGEKLCVRYSSSDDGEINFRDSPSNVVPVTRLRAARTAFAAMLLAACAPHGDGPPIQDLGDVAIEAMARDAKPSPDGGCEVQTGPFTTMLFPPGHAVCRGVTDVGDSVQPPPIRASGDTPVEVEVQNRPLMGEMAPPTDPVPEMGEAMPTVKEPCDPAPPQVGEAPVEDDKRTRPVMGEMAPDFEPPPPPPPSEKPQVMMGKIAAPKTGGAIIDDSF